MIEVIGSMKQSEREARSLTYADLMKREAALGVFGPFTKQKWAAQAPPKVRRNLERSRKWPWSEIKMDRQVFGGGPYVDTHVASGGALVSTAAEALWIAATFTPIFANDPKAGRIYIVEAGGIMSTGASGTLILIPQYGALGGTTLGTSQTVTVPINMANVAWYLHFTLAFRTIGAAGANSTCIGTGYFLSAPFTSAPAAGVSFVVPFGGTSASVDATINSGITISKTLSIAGSMTVQYAYIFSRN